MNWKASLDRYLTTEPENGFTDWVERVLNLIPDEFYNKHEDWLNTYNNQADKWLNKIYNKSRLTIQESAELIMRAHRLYIKN